MRIGLLVLLLPVVAAVLVARARLRMSCERHVEPAQVPLGSPLRGRLVLGQEGRLPAGILMLEDAVPADLGSRPRFLVDRADLSWRREVEYPLLGRVRGRFHTGPLMVRTTDPFGLVRLDRRFVATSEVMITPQVVAAAGHAGCWGRRQRRRGAAPPASGWSARTTPWSGSTARATTSAGSTGAPPPGSAN